MTKIRKPAQTTPIGAVLMCNTHRWLEPQRPWPRRRRAYNKNSFRLVSCAAASTVIFWFTLQSILSTPGCNIRSSAFWRTSHRTNPDIQLLQRRFPEHVSADMETILHPGFLFSDQDKLDAVMRSLEADLPREIEVPKFWNPPEYGSAGVRGFLGNEGDYLITPTEATAIGSKFEGKETIFVALASYRDPECSGTLEDIFNRATYPERIRVAIVDQRFSGDPICTEPADSCEQNPEQALCKFFHLIDSKEFEPSYMVGPTFARHLAYRMYRGEYFGLQVDSHVRFVSGWDEDLIDQWQSIGNEMAVISTYLNDNHNSIDPQTYQSTREKRSMMCNAKYEWKGSSNEHIRFGQQTQNTPSYNASPMLQPFWAAGFSFARGHFIVQVPYDQYLPMVFQGEEISMTVRGFTYGYDFYAPSRNVAFHIYAIHEQREERLKVKSFTENKLLYPSAKDEGYHRLTGIIRSGKSIEYNHIEEEHYGLGRVRSPELFYRTFGIHTEKSDMESDLCLFVHGTGTDSMHKRFSPLLRYDGMGIDYDLLDFQYRYIERVQATIDPVEYETLQKQLRAAVKKQS